MANSSWPRVKQVIEAALEQPAAERSAFVRQACGDDRALVRGSRIAARGHG